MLVAPVRCFSHPALTEAPVWLSIWGSNSCPGDADARVNLVDLNAEFCQNCWDSCTENFDRPRSFRLEGPGFAVIGSECAGFEQVSEVFFDRGGPFDSSACYNRRERFVAYCGLTTFTNPALQRELDEACN